MFKYPFKFANVGLYSHCHCIDDFIKATLSLGDRSRSDKSIRKPEQDRDEVRGEHVVGGKFCGYTN